MKSISQEKEGKDDVLAKLKFIGTLKAGEKIDVNYRSIESYSIITSFKRLIYGDGRNATYNFFTETINETKKIIDSCKTEDDIYTRNSALSYLAQAIQGIKATKQTYIEDKMFGCKLDITMDNILEYLLKFRNILKDEEFKDICAPIGSPIFKRTLASVQEPPSLNL